MGRRREMKMEEGKEGGRLTEGYEQVLVRN